MYIPLEQPDLFENLPEVGAESQDSAARDWQRGLAHDLRSPLFAVLGYLQLIQRQAGPASESKVGEYVALAQEAASRLNQLVDEFLHNTSNGPRFLPFEPRTIELSDLFKDLEHTFYVLAAPKTIHLSFDHPSDASIWADPKLLRRVLENLISNAVKFTPPGGSIKVSVRSNSTRFLFEVADTGRGIPRESISRIFERFHQVRPDDRSQGYGLGLAVAKLIVEGHRGKIEVDSELDRGSTFRFWIPAQPTLPSLGFVAALAPLD